MLIDDEIPEDRNDQDSSGEDSKKLKPSIKIQRILNVETSDASKNRVNWMRFRITQQIPGQHNT
jgi:hypothetical protein